MINKFRVLIFLFLLMGCRSETIDVSALNDHDRILFSEAAELEGVETTQNGLLKNWFVVYDQSMNHHGYTIPAGLVCKISIRTTNLNCADGGYDQKFRVVARHEIRHCFWVQHSTNPDSLMFRTASCWPIDY